MIRILYALAYLLIMVMTVTAQPVTMIEPFVSGLTRPVKIVNANDSRLFVAEIGGKIRVIKNGSLLATPFLDIGSKVNDPQWAGIFSIVFHPNYQTNGYFYVMYVVKDKFEVQISRFHSSPGADVAEPAETPVLAIPYTDVLGGHRGGDLAFGKDNFLYISTGDNGPGSRGVPGDPENNSQNTSKLFGKLIRIDVDSPTATDNILTKVWALGLRNPWRFSFDRETGDLWIGDNGQDKYEEIDFLKASDVNSSRNFGWDYFEGNYAIKNCNCATVFVPPIFVYNGFDNNGGQSASVMGGYVYRGTRYPSLKGWYFFGDYQSFKIGAIKDSYKSFLTNMSYNALISFGESKDGELYVLSFLDGTMGHLASTDPPLPVKLEYFSSAPEGCKINLIWKTSEEVNFSHFEIERSADGKNFSKIHDTPASGTNIVYNFTDAQPLPDTNYYRLKMVDNNGEYQFSQILKEKASCDIPGSWVFPNPSKEKFTVDGLKPGYKVSLFNNSGRSVLSERSVSGTKTEFNLKNYPPGIYIIKIVDETTGLIRKLKLVKE